MTVDPIWKRLGFTSGRRTYEGNRLVGGKPNSQHLHGSAADFTAPMSDVRAHFGPNVRIIDEGDHRHVQGLSNVPYYGNRGTAGLVNGVDTTAPKGASVPAPRRNTAPLPAMQPQTLQQPISDPQDDPLSILQQNPMSNPHQGTLADLVQTSMPQMAELQASKPGLFGQGGAGWKVLGVLGDTYLRANGMEGGYLPALQAERQQEREENFARERLAMAAAERRQERMAKAQEAPGWYQDAVFYNNLPNEGKVAADTYWDKTRPIAYSGPMGSGVIPRVQPNTQEIDGVTYYNVGGKWYDNPEGR